MAHELTERVFRYQCPDCGQAVRLATTLCPSVETSDLVALVSIFQGAHAPHRNEFGIHHEWALAIDLFGRPVWLVRE